jgi:hypothetical protein
MALGCSGAGTTPVRRDFFIGRNFSSFSDINSQALKWLGRVNSEVHGTTHEILLERLKLEGLKPLNRVTEYLIIREEKRTISRGYSFESVTPINITH